MRLQAEVEEARFRHRLGQQRSGKSTGTVLFAVQPLTSSRTRHAASACSRDFASIATSAKQHAETGYTADEELVLDKQLGRAADGI
jgi:hypothetical protein